MFSKRRQHSITITRGIGTMETIQFTMTTNDPYQFDTLVFLAESAISAREEDYYATEKAAAEAAQAEAAKKVKK